MPTHSFRRQSNIDDNSTHTAILQILPQIKDVTVTSPGNPIQFERKRNLLKNRYAMAGQVTVQDGIIDATIDGMGSMQSTFFYEIMAGLPDGMVYDHGITAATAAMNRSERFFGGSELGGLINQMQPRETVLMMTSANADNSPALIVLTDKRVLFMDRKLTGLNTREVNPKQITSITTGTAMGGETLEITVSNAVIKVSLLPHGRGMQLANAIRDLQANADEPQQFASPVPPAGPGVNDLVKLAELHSAGVLTDEEFAAAKAKALGL